MGKERVTRKGLDKSERRSAISSVLYFSHFIRKITVPTYHVISFCKWLLSGAIPIIYAHIYPCIVSFDHGKLPIIHPTLTKSRSFFTHAIFSQGLPELYEDAAAIV